ncbi:ABC transporter permease subunit [Sinomonas sp. ASV322]|uniref:ABC transporter permease n=1 Tax=Sinomonas sp. ASV322 TaxID=3041920 RepID=UPI0027DCC61F|nr:ABC transporter permease subunit [Sinomonas sp. ASV322]MDQ4502601.1 ABC transporter permease subunit [Sinomonas sp. ASV322]
MLLHSRSARAAVKAAVVLVLALLLGVPLLAIVLAAFAGSWNGVWPSDPTLSHLADALAADNLASISVSLQTALVASIGAVAVGAWAALAARSAPRQVAATIDALLHLPAAVPSVVVGLGLLAAFSRPPLTLNGTATIVVMAQTTLVLAFAYNTVAGAAASLDPVLDQVAGSLGARPLRVLLTVRLPLLLPSIGAALGLAFALCMGELGATIMVYPASWRTLPVSIFALADRGSLFLAAADTLVLIAVTVAVLGLIARLRGRTMVR